MAKECKIMNTWLSPTTFITWHIMECGKEVAGDFELMEHQRNCKKGEKMAEKNWNGNEKSIFSTLGASSDSEEERERDDYYATHPSTVKPLLESISINKTIWEPACGEGHLSEALKENGFKVFSTDLIDRGYKGFSKQYNFLEGKAPSEFKGDILTNPPYKYAQQFVERSLEIVKPNRKVIMFLKLQFLEGQKRSEMFKNNPPKEILVFSKRQLCAKNGDFKNAKGSAVAYAWFIWEKGFNGHPIVRWI